MRFRGFLTREDIELLEKASQRPLKHKKVITKPWMCNACSYTWFYKSLRCPTCSSKDIAEK